MVSVDICGGPKSQKWQSDIGYSVRQHLSCPSRNAYYNTGSFHQAKSDNQPLDFPKYAPEAVENLTGKYIKFLRLVYGKLLLSLECKLVNLTMFSGPTTGKSSGTPAPATDVQRLLPIGQSNEDDAACDIGDDAPTTPTVQSGSHNSHNTTDGCTTSSSSAPIQTVPNIPSAPEAQRASHDGRVMSAGVNAPASVGVSSGTGAPNMTSGDDEQVEGDQEIEADEGNDLECRRQQNIAQNEAILRDLGLDQHHISDAPPQVKRKRTHSKPPAGREPTRRQRRSEEASGSITNEPGNKEAEQRES